MGSSPQLYSVLVLLYGGHAAPDRCRQLKAPQVPTHCSQLLIARISLKLYNTSTRLQPKMVSYHSKNEAMLIPAPIHNCKLAAIDPHNVDVDPVAQNCSHVATAQPILEGEAQPGASIFQKRRLWRMV